MYAKRWVQYGLCASLALTFASGDAAFGQRFGGGGNQGGGFSGRGLMQQQQSRSSGGLGSGIIGRTLPGSPSARIRDPYYPNEGSKPDVLGTILPGLIQLGVNAAANAGANRQPRFPRDFDNGYPQPNYVQPVYPQPQYVQPQPPPAPVQPKKNVVVKRTAPKSNGDFNKFKDGFALNATAETDAQQVIEASEAQGRLEVATQADIDAIANPADKAAAQADFTKVVNASTPEEKAQALQDFKTKHGDKLGAAGQAGLDAQIQIGKYKQDLLNGTLTSAGKDQALAQIQTTLGGITNQGTKDAVLGKVTQMQDLNDLGKLAEASQGQPNPLDILMTGAGNAGFPPSFVGEMVGLPVMDVDPLADKPTATAITGGSVIVNPAESGGPVNYSLGQYQFSMEPGQSQKVDSGYTIAFDSGKGGQKSYKLGEGSYKFVVTDNGWDLRKTSFEVVLDNTGYKSDFHCVLNNEQMTVPAGQAVTLGSPYPLEIVFDRGDGGEPAHKLLLSGTYKVGVDPSETRLDLFDAIAIAQGPKAPDGFAQAAGGKPLTAAQKRAALIQEKLRAKTGANDAEKLLEQLRNRNRPAAGEGETVPPGTVTPPSAPLPPAAPPGTF